MDTETARPAGVYFYDSRPVNTILIAITRGGKGQTYIEPAFDVWLREKNPWNIFTTDPKGELLAKFYYPATVRGFEVVQFNLMNPNLTNVFNPLINALQKSTYSSWIIKFSKQLPFRVGSKNIPRILFT